MGEQGIGTDAATGGAASDAPEVRGRPAPLRARHELVPGHELDTDPGRLDVERIHRWLSTDAYWAMGRPIALMRRAIAGSTNLGVYGPGGAQVAYARIITDRATFAWLCDVYVDRGARGLGIGTALAQAVVDLLEPDGLKRIMLVTGDAHEVYAKAGFVVHPHPEQLMQRLVER